MADDQKHSHTETQEPPRRAQIIVIGAQIAKRMHEPGGLAESADISVPSSSLTEWLAHRDESGRADLLIVECPTLFPETVEHIRSGVAALRAVRAVVVYHFCQDSTREMMEERSSGITALRAPVTPEELKSACEADLAMAVIRGLSLQEPAEIPAPPVPSKSSEDKVPERQFSEEALSEISNISTAVACECPHHMASLLSALNAFEDYSRECENKGAEDAALHAYLYRRTARARAIMEDALVVLAEAEGIKIS